MIGDCEFDDYDEDDGGDILDLLEGDGCLFPEECLMPGYHYRCECYTREMVEDFEETREIISAPKPEEP